VSFDFTIDDEAKSDWDQATILTVLEKRGKGNEIYTEQATLKDLLGFLGVQLCVDGRAMGSFDGWADFPESAASGSPYGVYWDIEDIQVDGEPVTE
jgi:hypothetical protein